MWFFLGFLLGSSLSSGPTTQSRLYTPQEIASYFQDELKSAETQRANYCGHKPPQCMARFGCLSDPLYRKKIESWDGICSAG
jgi:hypothetical protein